MARRMAGALGWRYLDTGALYRAIAVIATERGIPPEDGPALGALTRSLELRQDPEGRTWVGDRDVSDAIRGADVARVASPVSAHPEVREALVDVQRRVAREGNLVCEGRDMGSVIFPRASLKIYLDARPGVRAERRHRELAERGESVAVEDVLQQLTERDARDRSRAHAPLKQLPDQVFLDTSEMSPGEVLRRLLELVAGCTRGSPAASEEPK